MLPAVALEKIWLYRNNFLLENHSQQSLGSAAQIMQQVDAIKISL